VSPDSLPMRSSVASREGYSEPAPSTGAGTFLFLNWLT
jgi:hypothetical protein